MSARIKIGPINIPSSEAVFTADHDLPRLGPDPNPNPTTPSNQVINTVTITTTTIVPRDHNKAVEFFEAAVSVDEHEDAMVALAAMYAG